jgi:8-oxo-dGTP diphosphatase
MMEIQEITRPVRLSNVPEDVLGFDLEMANSFRDGAPVICMIGTERYDAQRGVCVATIGSITRRDEEPGLIAWFLEHLARFARGHQRPKLATFSGTDNDLPWARERVQRFGLVPPEQDPFAAFEHLDLRVAFHKRTQNNQISLKKLEELFGIERGSSLSSRKVSYLLTDVLSLNGQRPIPERIFHYLGEDVHHLLLILERWNDRSLETHYLSEYEYLNMVVGLIKHSRKLFNAPPSRLSGRHTARLHAFAEAACEALEAAIVAESFEGFALPPLPAFQVAHPELERLRKRYERLAAIELFDREQGSYRLGRQLAGPKGTLALVRRNGRVLMIRRAEHIERAPGFWGLPGGVLEKGETPARGAVRELHEELGLAGEAVQLLGTQPSMSRAYELFWVEVTVEEPDALQPRPEEVAEARWVTPEEFVALEPLIPGAVEGFRQFLGPQWAAHAGRSKAR